MVKEVYKYEIWNFAIVIVCLIYKWQEL
jgi:hypothetical protein